MSVSAPSNTSAWTRDSGASPYNHTASVSSGTNVVLVVWVAWNAVGVTISSVTWDVGGANEALTAVGVAVTSGNVHVQGFVRINPTAGASKAIQVATSGSVSDLMISSAAFPGVDQTTPSANLTSNTTGGSLTVTAASGDATTSCIATSNAVTSTNQTAINTNPGVGIAVGDDYALASGNVTHTWTASGGTQVVQGFALKAAGGGGGASVTYPELERGLRGVHRGVVTGGYHAPMRMVRKDRIVVPAWLGKAA